MLLSMTGYGQARFESDPLTVSVELRTLNNRYLKISLRASEPYSLLEPEIEKVLRRTIRRGTIQIQLRVRRQQKAQDFQLNLIALQSYAEQLRSFQKQQGATGDLSLAALLPLPGVVFDPEQMESHDPGEDWTVVERVLTEAIERLQSMRREEGRAMGQELVALRDLIGRELAQIRQRSPRVVTAYRDKLHERVKNLLQESGAAVEPSDLIKEVSIFAERSDIAEEVVRLASHLDQFVDILKEPESPGRKLEFLTQEMFREANTIGSKANDVEIARHVVEIKGAIEKIRELIQNIE